MIAHHHFALELTDAHGEVAALDGDDGAPVHWTTQRLDEVNPGLRTDVALTNLAVLGVLAA